MALVFRHLATILKGLSCLFSTYCTPSSSAANFHNDESQHDNFEDEEDSEEDQDTDELLNKFTKKNGKKNKTGRKAQWTDSLLSDMIDIVVSSEYYKKKLIFTNTKNKKKMVPSMVMCCRSLKHVQVQEMRQFHLQQCSCVINSKRLLQSVKKLH